MNEQSFEVWVIFHKPSHRHIAGFLVIDRSPLPALVAFVEGCDAVALLIAKTIAEGRRSPETACDLRGRPMPEWIYKKPLLKLGNTQRGYGLISDVVGIFTCPQCNSSPVFTVATLPALKAMLENSFSGESAAASDGTEVR